MFKRPKFAKKTARATAVPSLDSFLPGHVIAQPTHWKAGVVFASPHSGHHYPDEFLSRTQLSIHELRRNEDMYIDQLISGAVLAGAPLLSARFPRCFVDVNRAEHEIAHDDIVPETAISARAQAGLGVVPTHLSETIAIYQDPISAAEIQARLNTLYHPYHRALTELITDAKQNFGQALLIDCHSMPGFAPMGARRPDIILGDRFGVSCHADSLNLIRTLFERAGYSVGINYPYAGGFVTENYGCPEMGVEAVQIEINRDLYLNPVTHAKKRGYQKLADDLADIAAQIVENAMPRDMAAQ